MSRMYGTAHLQAAKELLSLQESFESSPHDVKVIAGIARFFAKRNMFPGAITYMQQALGIQPDNAAFHCDLGNYLNKVGRQDDALYHVRRAIALNPRNSESLRQLGATLCSVRQVKAGIGIFSG